MKRVINAILIGMFAVIFFASLLTIFDLREKITNKLDMRGV